MLHTVYRTTNSLNGSFYIGYHKTMNPDDSYLGSGLLLRRAIAKHGQENFRKEVVAVFDNARDAFARERELLADCWGQSGCYNIHEGGYGGFEYINRNGLCPPPRRGKKRNLTAAGRQVLRNKMLGQPAWNRGGSMPVGFGERVAAAKRGKARPPNVGLAVATANSYRPPVRWINRDGVVLKVEVSRLDSFLAEGWKFGRK